MERMRKIGAALERIQVECSAVPTQTEERLGESCTAPGPVIKLLVSNSYLDEPIICDGWGEPLRYVGAENFGGQQTSPMPSCASLRIAEWANTYLLISLGMNGTEDMAPPRWSSSKLRFEADPTTGPCENVQPGGSFQLEGGGSAFSPRAFECDIAFGNGQFIVFPQSQ